MTSIRGLRGLAPRRWMLPYAGGAVVAAVVVVVLVEILGIGHPAGAAKDGLSGESGAETQTSLVAFSIAGDASKLISPGVSVPIDLALTNPHDVEMTISGLQVVVREVSAPQADGAHPCTVDDFRVDQAPGGLELRVLAGETSTLRGLAVPRAGWPQVGMRDRSVNQDGCKGASLTLGYTATGRVPSP